MFIENYKIKVFYLQYNKFNFNYKIINIIVFVCRLRKVKMDQRKLMDNANTITDMAKVSTIENFTVL